MFDTSLGSTTHDEMTRRCHVAGPFYLIGGGLHGEVGLVGCVDNLTIDGQLKVFSIQYSY